MPFGAAYAFYKDSDRRGHVDISLKLRDSEALKNTILIRVTGVYESGRFFSGRASLTMIGKYDVPRSKQP